MSLQRLLGALAVGATLAGLSTPVAAQVIPDSLRACRAQSDDTRRLQCYDREIDRHPPSPAEVPANAQVVTEPAAPANTQAERPPSAPAANPPTSETVPDMPSAPPAPASQPRTAPTRLPMFKARITALSFRRSGELVVTLDNGQIWTQYVADGKVPLTVGDTVTIRPGWLGTYLLVGPSSWLTKVRELAAAPP